MKIKVVASTTPKHGSLISIAANIYNGEAIDKYIKSASRGKSKNIGKWLSSTVRKYLINKYEDGYAPVRKVPTSAPEWAQKAAESGDLVKITIRPNFKQDIEHAIAWLESLGDKPYSASVEEAIKQGEERIKNLNKKAADSETDEDSETIWEIPGSGGWRWVRILTAKGCEVEGKHMQHCVGDDMQSYKKGIASGKLEIWSLRDPKNHPHATIEAVPSR